MVKHLYLPVFFFMGCTLSRPVSGPGYDYAQKCFTHPGGSELVVAVTNARLHYWRRGAFDRYTQEVYAKLDTHEGYLGDAIKREIFGREVWTFTAWRDRVSQQKFIHSADHLNAMYMAREAIDVMRSLEFAHPSSDLLTWDIVSDRIESVPFRKLPKL